MDDVGSSSKQFEVYSNFFWGNLLFLKYFTPFAAWGPYIELTEKMWKEILQILANLNVKMTVAITACWVEKDGSLIPFTRKFPKQAAALKKGVEEGLIEVANHGLTHCVVGKHLPRLFSSNRKFHREFWKWIPKEIHYRHLEESQKKLQDYFGKVLTFVPPGGVWTKDTEIAAFKSNIRYLCASSSLVKTGKLSNGLIYIEDSDNLVFHDRDISKNGINWLKDKLKQLKNDKFEMTTVLNFAQDIK